jgi:hemerythrin-like domain-containing protein
MKPRAVDLHRVKPIDAWHADHAAFNRLLDLLDAEVMAFHDANEPNYPLMLDILCYLRDYLDMSHHPREEVAFTRMAERDPGLSIQVNRRKQEHRVIGVAADRLIKCLNEVIDGDLVPRSDLEQAAATYLVYYRNHLAAEEASIIPHAEKLLGADDWAAVAAAAPAAVDPLSGEGFDYRYQELRRAVARYAKQ